jgi:hypothetical protein
MAKIKLTKTAVKAAQPEAQAVELLPSPQALKTAGVPHVGTHGIRHRSAHGAHSA